MYFIAGGCSKCVRLRRAVYTFMHVRQAFCMTIMTAIDPVSVLGADNDRMFPILPVNQAITLSGCLTGNMLKGCASTSLILTRCVIANAGAVQPNAGAVQLDVQVIRAMPR